MSNEIQEALVQAMDTISKVKDKQLVFDRTIQCAIIRPVNAANGEYKVEYTNKTITQEGNNVNYLSNGTFSAYDLSLGMKYRSGDIVYVQIPENNMSNKKIITGKVSTKTEDLVDTTQDYERVDKIGIPFEQIYDFEGKTSGGVVGFIGEEKDIYQIYNRGSTNKNELFQTYAKNQKHLMFYAEFKTSWLSDKVKSGNYGLSFSFTESNGNITQDYTFELDKKYFTGNYMNYRTYTPVYIIIELDGNKLISLDSVQLYANNFIREDEHGKSKDDENEIFVQNVSIQWVQPFSETGYHAHIVTPAGVYFDDVESLKLFAQLKYNGRTDNIHPNLAKFYWFKQDLSVSITDSNYTDIGGIGWKKLQSETQEIDIKKSSGIPSDDFYENQLQQKYKCVIYYEDKLFEDEVTLYKSFETANIYTLTYKNNVLEVSPPLPKDNREEYYYSWYSIDNNGTRTIITNNNPFYKVILSQIKQYKTFYCEISQILIKNDPDTQGIDETLMTPIATLSKTIYSSGSGRGFDVFFNTENNGVFMYDEAGDLYTKNIGEKPITKFQLNYEVVSNSEGNIIDIEKITFGLKGNEQLNNSMITIEKEPYYYNNDNKISGYINYTIKNRYSYKDAYDTIIVMTLITTGDETYTFEYPLTFIKEGNPGTNGTSLILYAEPASDDSIRALKINDGSITSQSISFKLSIYDNGKPIDEKISDKFVITVDIPEIYRKNNPLFDFINKNYNYSIGFDESDSDILILTFNENLNSVSTYNSIINIKATPKENSGYEYPLYLPIAIPLTIAEERYLTSGARTIFYDADGYNPKYDDSSYVFNDNYVYDNINLIKESIGSIKDNTYIPSKSYDTNGNYAVLNFDDMYYQPIVYSINAFSKSILNSWDGSSLVINPGTSSIVGAQAGFGTKNNNNKFTGVLLGLLNEPDKFYNNKYGLYGFNNGITSFGFLDEGKAFIGEPTRARILFDGTESIIQSANGGMLINLNDELIKSPKFKLKSDNLILDSESKEFLFNLGSSSGSFKIQGLNDNNSNITLFEISGGSQGKYLLQSADKSFSINLKNGNITANKGSFSGDVIIGNSSITNVLDDLDRALKNANKAASAASSAASDASDAIGALSEFFDITVGDSTASRSIIRMKGEGNTGVQVGEQVTIKGSGGLDSSQAWGVPADIVLKGNVVILGSLGVQETIRANNVVTNV